MEVLCCFTCCCCFSWPGNEKDFARICFLVKLCCLLHSVPVISCCFVACLMSRWSWGLIFGRFLKDDASLGSDVVVFSDRTVRSLLFSVLLLLAEGNRVILSVYFFSEENTPWLLMLRRWRCTNRTRSEWIDLLTEQNRSGSAWTHGARYVCFSPDEPPFSGTCVFMDTLAAMCVCLNDGSLPTALAVWLFVCTTPPSTPPSTQTASLAAHARVYTVVMY